jgi:hypothetical protein
MALWKRHQPTWRPDIGSQNPQDTRERRPIYALSGWIPTKRNPIKMILDDLRIVLLPFPAKNEETKLNDKVFLFP